MQRVEVSVLQMGYRRIVVPGLITAWIVLNLILIWKSVVPVLPHAFSALTSLRDVPRPHVGQLIKHAQVVAGQGLGGILLVFSLFGLGKVTTRWLGWPRLLTATETCAASVLTGVGMYSTLALALGLSGLMFPLIAVGTWVAACGAASCVRLPRWSFDEIRLFRSGDSMIAGLTLMMIGGLVIFAMAPETTVDALSYHLAAPEHTRSLHKLVDTPHLQFRWPLLAEQLITIFLGILSPHIVNVIAFLALALLMYGWVQRRWGMTAALFSLAGLLIASDISRLVPIVKPDLLAVSFSLLAVVLWDRMVLSSRCRRVSAVLLGAALGWAFCTKFTAVAIGVGILTWHVFFHRSFLRPTTVWLTIAGFITVTLPYLTRTWILTGNPVYPFLMGGFQWSALNVQLMRYGWPIPDVNPRDPSDVFNLLVGMGTVHVSLAFIGIPLLLFTTGVKELRIGHLAMCIAGSMVAWIWIFQAPFLRFMIPIFPVIIILGSIALASFNFGKGRPRALLPILVAVVVILGYLRVVAYVNMAGTAKKPILPVAFGLVKPAFFQERVLTTYWESVSLLNRLEPSRGRLLLVGDARGTLFSRSRVTLSQDIADFPLVLKIARASHSPEEIFKRFKQLGVSVVGLDYVYSARQGVLYTPFYWKPEEIKRYYEFCLHWLEPLGSTEQYDFQNGGWDFYRVRNGRGRPNEALFFLPGTEGLVVNTSGASPAREITRLKRLVTLAPRVAAFQCQLGSLLVNDRRWQEALPYLYRGLMAGFPDAEPHGKLGLALWNLKRYQEAESAFKRAAQRNPSEPSYEQWRQRCALASSS